MLDNNLEEAQKIYAFFSDWREANDAIRDLPYYSAPSGMYSSLWFNVLEGKTFESYNQESAGLYCEPNTWNAEFYRDIAISSGKCQFGDYQIEFYQYWDSVYRCYGQDSFCGIRSEDREVDPDWTILVKDINGNVVATNIDIDENASVIELYRVPTNFPYMVLRTNIGGARSLAGLHFFTAKPSFKQVTSIDDVSGWRDDGKYVYSNEHGEWLVDKYITVATPHLSALSDWLHFWVAYKLVDDHFERADEHIKANLKVYSETELADIDKEALQIRALIDAQTYNKWDMANLLFSGRSDVPLSGKFFWRFTDFVYEGQEDLAWRFFERAIPDSYDMLSGTTVSMYTTKNIMRETMKIWIEEYFPLGAEALGEKAETDNAFINTASHIIVGEKAETDNAFINTASHIIVSIIKFIIDIARLKNTFITQYF